MSDDVARAVGAGIPTELTVNGKECRLKPLTVRELAEIQRDCLKHYRKDYLEALRDGYSLLPPERAEALMLQKIEETSRWDIKDLPPQIVYDPQRVHVTDGLKEWLKEELEAKVTMLEKEDVVQRLTASALDSGTLTPAEYKTRTGFDVRPVRVGYMHWWVTATIEGLMSMAFFGLHPLGEPITRQDVAIEFTNQYAELVNVARQVEEQTKPDVGNGQDSPTE